MIKQDSDALECDLAEVYHIYDMRSFPLKKIAILACGLGQDSRIVRSIAGSDYTCNTLLLMTLVDLAKIDLWSKAKEGAPKPELLTSKIFGQTAKKSWTIEDFEARRKEILNG